MKEAMIEKSSNRANRGVSSRKHNTTLPPIKISTNASGLPSKLPPGLCLEKDDPIVSDWISAYKIPEIIKIRLPQEKYRVPVTTQSEVGWVWGNASKPTAEIKGSTGSGERVRFNTLETFPRESHGKRNILKWWGGIEGL